MTNATDKQAVLTLWQSNYLNIRRATTGAKESNRKVIVGVELYDVSIDRQNKLYPWAKEALNVLSSCNRYSVNIWSIYNEDVMTWAKNNVFVPNGVQIDGMNSGFFIYAKEYSSAKPVIDVNIDLSSGFESINWYWVYQLFRVSEAMLCEKDNSVIRSVVTGNEKFAIRPTTVRVPNSSIPVAKPVTPKP